MGNLIGCYGGGSDPTVLPPEAETLKTASSGTPGRNISGKGFSESSSSEYSGLSFGDNLTFEDSFPSGELLDKPNLRVFTFAELKSATKNFKPETLLGEGGFGKVYKGWIDEKTNVSNSKSGLKIAVAIKKLNSGSVQGFEEWQCPMSDVSNPVFSTSHTNEYGRVKSYPYPFQVVGKEKCAHSEYTQLVIHPPPIPP